MEEKLENLVETDEFLEGWNDSLPETRDADELPQEGGENDACPSTEGTDDGIASGGSFAPPGEMEMRADLAEFARCFPQAANDPASIPDAVWTEVGRGRSLTVAYGQWALEQERQRRSSAEEKSRGLERQRDNARRSTGSMRGSGIQRGRDPFLEGWEE